MALEHLNSAPAAPRRVVVLGAGGFVGGTAAARLRDAGVPTLGLGRPELDLLAEGAGERLISMLEAQDTLVVVAAQAPCKNPEMLRDNLRMLRPVERALGEIELAQVVYVSSDAVYADLPTPLDETSPAAPRSLHGAMHLAREVVLESTCSAPLGILRPTLIYGAGDPHNGYGPNRFLRLAADGRNITLFGEGEERRDHVWIDDVAELIHRMVLHRSRGILNAATGTVTSFREVAGMAAALFDTPTQIGGSPRNGPMPHNGYRPFDPAATTAAFPDFRYMPLAEGLERSRPQA